MANLGSYFAYFGTSAVLLALGLTAYVLFTPYRELTLIRDGNSAAAYSLGGAAIGMAVAIGGAVAHSTTLLDMTLWAGVASVTQMVAYLLASLAVPGLKASIINDRASHGIFLGAISLAVGILNAAALTD